MLETVDLDARLTKEIYRNALDDLDIRLAALQRELHTAGVPVLVVFEGWDAAGKGSVLNRVLRPLDPRGFSVYNVLEPSNDETMWPPMWRFWNILPANGSIAIYSHSWYRQVLDEYLDGEIPPVDWGAAYERIRVFERQLTDDGAVIVKFFLHLSKKEQAKRFDRMSKDPAFAWKIGKEERRRHRHYDDYYQAVEDMLRETSTANAPWTLVPSTRGRFANVRVGETLLAAFENALQPAAEEKPAATKAPRRTSPLDRADLSLTIPEDEYGDTLDALQDEVRRLQHLCYIQRRPVVMVYEGWDAGGKGGNIRRMTREMDPRGYEVVPIAAPEGDEKTHHYLWRFWRKLPKAGHFAIFDRSWYGRLMVERVEGFAAPHEWARAFREINEFEMQLVEYGTILMKFWIHISQDEQLRRFEARQETPHKQWKITEEDWRNRERWDDYWQAVSDMLEMTSTTHAPWTIVEGNDKRFARIRALRVVVERLTAALTDSDKDKDKGKKKAKKK